MRYIYSCRRPGQQRRTRKSPINIYIHLLTSLAVRAFLRARAASSADLAADVVISNKAASKFRMRSAAADNLLFPSLLLLIIIFLVGDLEAMAVADFADRGGDRTAVMVVLAEYIVAIERFNAIQKLSKTRCWYAMVRTDLRTNTIHIPLRPFE